MSDNRPLMSWNAVDAMRKDVPIHEVAVPVSKACAMAGVAVDTLVWSTKETKRQTDKAGIAIISRFVDMAFRWPPTDSASLSRRGASSRSAFGGGPSSPGSAVGVVFRSSLLRDLSVNSWSSWVLFSSKTQLASAALTGGC
jgi:hypothetical protein